MVKWQFIELRYQLTLCILSKQLINLTQILLIRIQFLILVNHQDKRLKQVAFTVIPEVITLSGTGVTDDDVGQNLSHQGVSIQV